MAELYLGMSYDVLGDRQNALIHYNAVSESQNVDAFLKASAEHWLEERFTEDDAEGISPILKYIEDFGHGV